MSTPPVDNPRVIAFPPALYAGTLVAAMVIHSFFPISLLAGWTTKGLGGAAIFVAAFIAVSAIRTMRRAKTAVNPGLPTTAIVSDGMFSRSRNPIYLAFTLLYLGIALLCNSFWAVLLLLPLLMVVQTGIIKREESYLESKFGQEYLRYKARVRRWI